MLRILKFFAILIQFTIIKCSETNSEGTSSLTFVIDDSRSIVSNMQDVKNNVDGIMNIVLENTSQIKDIVLVTFNDPDVKLKMKTRDLDLFKHALNKIEPNNYFNNDCPEMVLSAVKRGLEESLPGSYIYVFTDGIAKDFRLVDSIKILCQRTKSQVSFVLTGDCHHPNSRGYKVFYEIAAASSGQVFRVRRNEIDSVLKPIQEIAKGKHGLLTSKILRPNVYSQVPFTVVNGTESIIVSVSGIDVALLGISGPTTSMEKIMWNTNGKIVRILNPGLGDYVASVSGTSLTFVAVYTKADFSFNYGFSEVNPLKLEDTSRRPAAGIKNYLALSISDPKNEMDVQSAQILDMDENVITEIPLTIVSGNFYTTSPFNMPFTMFKVAIKGLSKTGIPLRRISKVPVEPIPPIPEPIENKAPIASISEGTKKSNPYGRELSITCKVIAYPDPYITWRDDKGFIFPAEILPTENEHEYISLLRVPNLKKSAKFYCGALNIEGEDTASIDVIVQSTITVAPEVTMDVEYGKSVTIECGIKSQMPIVTVWSHINNTTEQTEIVRSSEKYLLSWDRTKLMIRFMDFDLVGKYSCKSSLLFDLEQYEKHDTEVKIKELIPPKFDITHSLIEANENTPATIECKLLEGAPKPTISWQFKSRESREYVTIPGFEEYLRIPAVVLHGSGHYRCVAENSAGHDDKTTELIVPKAPLAAIIEGTNLIVPYGAEVTLACKVTAYPAPTITWSNDEQSMLPSETLPEINEYEYLSRLRNVSIKKTTTYSCHAENSKGTVTESVVVFTQSPFQVLKYPKERVEVEYGKEHKIRCVIKSTFPTRIQWFRSISNTNTLQKIPNSSDKYDITADKNELTIKFMDSDVEGKYTCKASLLYDGDSFKAFDSNVFLGDFAVATILQQKPAVMKVKTNTDVIIPCKILAGKPKSTIKWYFKGTHTGKFESINKTGEELRITAASLTHGGHYKCTAVNKKGFSETESELVVEDDTGHTEDVHTIYLLVGETTKIKCLVPHSTTDSIKWYMNGDDIMVHETYLPLSDVDMSMDGNYTCVVTNSQGSHSDNYIVDIGYSPVFIMHMDTNIINWSGPEDLNCDVRAKPEPKAEWTYNGVPVDISNDTLNLAISGWGQYICNISNVHGYVLRSFNVTLKECLINKNIESATYTPLLLHISTTLPVLDIENEFLVMKAETRFKLSCHNHDETPNSFKKFPEKHELEVTCNYEDTFLVDGKSYKYSDFHCERTVLPVVIRTQNTCLGKNTELIRVGFMVEEFIEVYKVCFETEKFVPLHTHFVMHHANGIMNMMENKWFLNPGMGVGKINTEYTCQNDLSTLCYARTQLVNAQDVNFGPAQTSTFIDNLNTVALWKPRVDFDKMTWQAIENKIRLQNNLYNEINIWSGASNYSSKGSGNIPRYLWKVVKFDKTHLTAIIYVNDPSPTDSDVRCNSTCSESSASWFESTDIFTYCCDLEDFIAAFELHENLLDEILPPDIDIRFNYEPQPPLIP